MATINTYKIEGLGWGGSVSKVLSLEALGFEFNTQHPCKTAATVALTCNPHPGNTDTDGVWGHTGQTPLLSKSRSQ